MPRAAAKFYIEAAVGSLVLLRKINEPTAASSYYLARSNEKRLFPQRLSKDNLARSNEKRLIRKR
jgi:hypothetical protein